MRTTLDLDQDVLLAVKSMAALQQKSAGKVLSELARVALKPRRKMTERNGFLVLPKNPAGIPVTLELVNQLRDEDP